VTAGLDQIFALKWDEMGTAEMSLPLWGLMGRQCTSGVTMHRNPKVNQHNATNG